MVSQDASEYASVSGGSSKGLDTPPPISLLVADSRDVENRINTHSQEQRERLSQILSKVHALESSAGMGDSSKACQQDAASIVLTTNAVNGGLSLNTARASPEITITPGIEAKGPKSTTPTTPDPAKVPQSSLWGTLGDILSPMKVTVERTYERVNRRALDKLAKLYAQKKESAPEDEEEGGDLSPMFEGGGRRLVLTTDGHSYEGGLNAQKEMHGYGRLTWPDFHTYQVCRKKTLSF